MDTIMEMEFLLLDAVVTEMDETAGLAKFDPNGQMAQWAKSFGTIMMM